MLERKRYIMGGLSGALILGSLLISRPAMADRGHPVCRQLGYGAVCASLVDSSNGQFTYLFTVKNIAPNTNCPKFEIKGLGVLSPVAPIAQSHPLRTRTSLNDFRFNLSFWEMAGARCVNDDSQCNHDGDDNHGNNGVGNGVDPQPPGNPPVNDGPGTGPGNPGNKGGAKGHAKANDKGGHDNSHDHGYNNGNDDDGDPGATISDNSGCGNDRGDGGPDNSLKPGETAPTTRTDLVFTLTFRRQVDVSQFCYVLHVVDACSCRGFFTSPNPAVCGQVICVDSNGTHGIAGATVNLVNGTDFTNVVATTTADGNGNFMLIPPSSGVYEVSATATNWGTNFSAPFNFNARRYFCGDLYVNVQLMPLPVNVTISNGGLGDISGIAYFSDNSNFVARATSQTLTNEDGNFTDLRNAANAWSVNGNHTYPFTGRIPHHENLGHFGGPGEKPVYVLILQPLVAEDQYVGHTFVNMVSVQDNIGSATAHDHDPFSAKFLSNLPVEGPGTAFAVTTAAVQLVYQDPNVVQVSGTPDAPADLSTVLSNGNPNISSPPPPGVVPPGFMHRTICNVRIASGANFVVFVKSTFQNVCGDSTTVNPDPFIPASPL